MANANQEFDIVIVGGGMVGASLACALRGLPLRVAMVEAVPIGSGCSPSFDTRAIALAQVSRRIFQGIGVWETMLEHGVTPIRYIHTSDRGHFGATRLRAEEEGVEALGYVAEAGVLGSAFEEALGTLENLTLFAPAQLTGVTIEADAAHLTLDGEGGLFGLSTRLLVAADGGHSTVRALLGANTFGLNYGQSAVIANVYTDTPHQQRAFERFTDTGPLAMLPNDAPGLPESARWSLVWSVRNDQVEEHLELEDEEFLERLQERLGLRTGRLLDCGPRASYPLALDYVRDHVRPRLAFIGNAAHTIHPVGGQGFNLGLRDVAVLAEVLHACAQEGGDPGASARLQGYAQWRRADYLKVMAFTDGLARLFSNNFAPLVVGRNLGLVGVDILPALKRRFARQAMGLNGRLPKLACGVPLG